MNIYVKSTDAVDNDDKKVKVLVKVLFCKLKSALNY